MYPVYLVIFFHVCSAFAKDFTHPSNLVNVAEGKRTMFSSETPVESSKWEHQGRKWSCQLLSSTKPGQVCSALLDLGHSYPIVQIGILSFNKYKRELGAAANVAVRIDDELCNIVYIRDGFTNFTCVRHTQGRVLTLESFRQDLFVCSFFVYTCKTGRRGPKCKWPCASGSYGPGCIFPCNCAANVSCKPESGFCKSGCRDLTAGRSHDCYHQTPHGGQRGQFVNVASGAVSVVTSGDVHLTRNILEKPEEPPDPTISAFDSENSATCEQLTSDPNDNASVSLKMSFSTSFRLHSIVVVYSILNITPPFSIHVTSNGRSIFGQTHHKPLSRKRFVFRCQRPNVEGNDIVINHSSHADLATTSNTDLATVVVCQVKIRVCHIGFYGPNCHLRCRCFGSSCDPVTGACNSGGRCASGSKGRNCAELDVLQTHKVGERRGSNVTTTDHHQIPWHTLTSLAGLPRTANQILSSISVHWLAVQMDGVYQIHAVTLHVRKTFVNYFRAFAIFTDTAGEVGDIYSSTTYGWRGVGCTRHPEQRLDTTLQVTCHADARVLTVVAYGNDLDVEAALEDMQVWVCVDGTFGSRCEGVCNCRDRTEICDKRTGVCSSGCPQGYSGPGCQSPCTQHSTNSSACWSACHCADAPSGCGPGVVLCDGRCQPGWMGVACDLPCPQGRYGAGCREVCGACLADVDDRNCDARTGFCLGGCANELLTPNCKPGMDHVGLGTLLASIRRGNAEVTTEDAVKIVIIGMVTSVIGAVVLCMCARLCWLRYQVSQDGSVRRGSRLSATLRRLISPDLDNEIIQHHGNYHEDFVQRVIHEQYRAGDVRSGAEKVGFRDVAADIQQKRAARTPPRDDGRCKPLEDNTQQDADNRVANWILDQEFDVLINRRKERLKQYTDDILLMEESSYAVGELVAMTPESLDQLYQDVGRLGIP